MSRYFNIQTGADGAVTIFLYGEIGDYAELKSGNVAAELKMAESSGAPVEIRINSIGGEVYSGIAIYNMIKSSKADIRIYVDGVAASMAAVIALCGKPVEMSKYSRLMLHSVSGGCYGNKTELRRCIDEIEDLEESLSDILAAKLKMDKETVRSTYFNDVDHWLTAQEALELGFVDAIYDSDPVPAESTPEQIYNIYNNRLSRPKKEPNSMNIDDLKKRQRFKDCADDAAVHSRLDELESDAGKVPGLEKEVADLKGKIKVYEDKAAAEEAEERKALLDKAESEGRINATTRPTFENILRRDMAEGRAALEAIPPKRNVMHDIRHTPTNESPWEKRMSEIRKRRYGNTN